MQLQRQNDNEAKSIDSIFAEKQERQERIRQLEQKIDEEKRAAEHVVRSMEPSMMESYQALKAENNKIEKVRLGRTSRDHPTCMLLLIAILCHFVKSIDPCQVISLFLHNGC